MWTRASRLHRLRIWIVGLLVLAGANLARAAPAITFDPSPKDFGEVFGPMELVEPITIINTGDAPLDVTEMALSGDDLDVLFFDDTDCGRTTTCTLPYTLPPGGARSFDLGCEVIARAGSFAATLTVTSNAPGTNTVEILCTGVFPGPAQISVSPTSLTFPIVRAEAGSATLALTVSNPATPPADALVFEMQGEPWFATQHFTVTGPCTSCWLDPGASAVFSIRFHPQNNAVHDLPITIAIENPGIADVEVPLFAQGSYPFLAFDQPADPAGFDVGTVPLGQAVTGTIIGRNTGLVPLRLFGALASGAFTLVAGPPANTSVPPDGTVEWTIACTPLDFERAFGTLSIDTDTNLGTVFVDGGCQGLELEVGPDALDLGTVEVGEPGIGELVVRNLDTEGTFAITELRVIETTGGASFVVHAELPRTLAPGEVATFDVELVATEPGDHAAVIEVYLDADPEPYARVGVSAVATMVDEDPRGCGCTTGGPGELGLFALAIVLVLRRRR